MESEISRPVGVVIERRPAKSRWVEHVWTVVEVLDGAAETPAFARLASFSGGRERYFAGNAALTLYRSDADAYRVNLESDRVLYVVMRRDESREHPWVLYGVTASPHEAGAHVESGEEMVEAVPMPAAILQWVEAFYALHHKDERFVKRRRGKVDVERLQFSKEPIFARTGRFPGGESGGADD